MTAEIKKPDRNPFKPLQSPLLQYAQDINQLEYIINLYVEGDRKTYPLVLCGMQSGGRPAVRKVELDAAEAEMTTLAEWLYFEQGEQMQAFLLSPSCFTDMTYVQACEMTAAGVPEGAVRALLTGFFMGHGHPYPSIRAHLLAKAMSLEHRPARRPKGKGKKHRTLN